MKELTRFGHFKARRQLGVNRPQYKKLISILPNPASWATRRKDLVRLWCQGMSITGDLRMNLDHKGRITYYGKYSEETGFYHRQWDKIEALTETSYYFYKDGTTARDSRCPDVPLTRILKKRRDAVLSAHRAEFGASATPK